MKDINEQVLRIMKILKSNSKSLIEDTKYDSFHAYMEGYIDGLNITLTDNLRGEITRFFEAKGNPKTNCYWTNQIKYRNKDKTNDELVEILLETTEEYFLKTPNWYKEMDQTKIEKDLPVWFNGFKNWPYMFVQLGLALPVYLEAFVDGLNVYSSKNLRLEISQWFYQKTKQEESYHWTRPIIAYYEGRSEDVTKKLIEVTEEYFKTSKVF